MCKIQEMLKNKSQLIDFMNENEWEYEILSFKDISLIEIYGVGACVYVGEKLIHFLKEEDL